MPSESRNCQNCKNQFTIEPEDFAFYEKIKVPPPTFCPQCRMQRRLLFRNERVFYSKNCDLCKKKIISMYSSDVVFPVYCYDCWWSDKWGAETYGRGYDFSRPFFEQLKDLWNAVPRACLVASQNVNSPYANFTYKCKNVYLSSSTIESEDVLYSWASDKNMSLADCYEIAGSELCYQSFNVERCYRSIFLVNSNDCLDSGFLYDCSNCKNCFLSSNLRNRQYMFKNIQCGKEEYQEKIRPYLGSISGQERAKREFHDLLLKSVHRFARIIKSVNATGDNINNVKNVRHGFDVYDVEDIAYAFRCFEEKDSMDIFGAGPGSNHSYEGMCVGLEGSMEKFCAFTWENVLDIEYCAFSHNVQDSFGCIGLRNKRYSVLNKQYPKEEYEALVAKIKKHMAEMPFHDRSGKIYGYGEFFPPEFSPFAYNETIAHEYYPLTKEGALNKGYQWKDQEIRQYEITLKSEDLPDHISNVGDSIVKETIGCIHAGKCNEQCTFAFRIIPQELELYRKLNVPLPKLCPNCRHFERLKLRNPMKLWHRQCTCAGIKSDNGVYANQTNHFHGANHCPNEFETSYAPERPEIVYCEQCYQAEVI